MQDSKAGNKYREMLAKRMAKANWVRLNGKWSIKNSKLNETRAWISPWGYYALLDVNSIRSSKHIKNVKSISLKVKLYDQYRKRNNSRFVIAFAVKNPYRKFYVQLFGLQLTGNSDKITNAQFIVSDRKNKQKSYLTKYNYFVRGYKKSKFIMDFNKEYNLTFKFYGNLVTFFCNNKKISSVRFPHANMNGAIAFATMHIKAAIDNVKVLNTKNKIIFQDNFDDPSTLFVPGIKAKITSKKRKKK